MTSSDETNSYSARWFDFFHVTIDQKRTALEIEFICRCAPRLEFKTILDVCCGMGRHARELSVRGYSVVGIDRDEKAIAAARDLGGGPKYVVADIRDYQRQLIWERPQRRDSGQPESRDTEVPPTLSGKFDAVIVMGQSFGHFDEATNYSILSRLASSVRDGGRVILDLWNPEFFDAHQGERELKTARGNVRELKRVDSNRLLVQLGYPDGVQEKFEWQLFSPEQMDQLAKSMGLRLVNACCGFAATNPPSPADPRLQFVLERAS